MKYFNRKEEVIDIQLTQYGKCLLAAGRFSPEYYAFYDDDILYDTNHASYDESHIISENRIKETPRIKAQSVFLGRDLEFNRTMKNFSNSAVMNPNDSDYVPYQSTDEVQYALGLPLGTSNYNSSNRPSWSVNFLNGKLNSSTSYITGSYLSDGRQMNIPQLDVKIRHQIKIGLDQNMIGGDPEGLQDLVGGSKNAFEDGTYFILEDDYLLLDIKEENGMAENQNFMIEVYEIESDGDGKEILRPLRFSPKPQRVVNNLLVDEEDINLKTPNINPDFTDYFFELSKDEEIDRDKFDIYSQKITNLFTDQSPSTMLRPALGTLKAPSPPALGTATSIAGQPLVYKPDDFAPEDIYTGMDANEDIECDDE